MLVSRPFSFLFAASFVATLSLSGPAAAGGFSAMVADVETGSILTAEQIDAPRDPVLISRLATITMGIQDMADDTLTADEDLDVRTGDTVSAMMALQSTALGEAGYRAPMTALAARIGYNAKLFEDRIRAIGARVGLRATTVKVVRGSDGGPAFEGRTTLRDTVRLATSLVRAHGPVVDGVFAPATGNLETTRIWMSEEGTCLLVARGPMTGRDMVAGLAGAPSASECFEAAAVLLAEQDQRIIASR